MIVLDGITTYSEYICPILSGEHSGEILLITSKGAYFQLEDRIFMLTDVSFGCTPLGILIDMVGFLTFNKWTTGQSVSIVNGTLHFPGVNIHLQPRNYAGPAPIAFTQALISSCVQQLQHRCKNSGLSRLCAPLFGSGDVPTDPVCQTAYPLIISLLQALQCNDTKLTESTLQDLLGMGIGLTPSADDVILGFMYTLLRIAPDRRCTQILRDSVIHLAPVCTNAISAAYLRAVATGAPFERLDRILQGLCGQCSLNIDPILEIGSSSGSEMLLGLLLAAKLIYL